MLLCRGTTPIFHPRRHLAPMAGKRYESDVIIAGGGISGIVMALELLDAGIRVLILDRDAPDRFGGLAREAFGGIFFVGTPEQRHLGIRDTPELALQDWLASAELRLDDVWPRRWAERYVDRCTEHVYRWLRERGIRFIPMVHWVERGLYRPGNSVPRFHMVWGTGRELTLRLLDRLERHTNRERLQTLFRHRVTDLSLQNGIVTGVRGVIEDSGKAFEARAGVVVIASGGICGSIPRLRQHWYAPWGDPPGTLLNGSHRFAIGDLHNAAQASGGHVTHLDKQWHYAAGVHHPVPRFEGQGLSLVPPKSALWLNHRGERIGPAPLVSGFDTRYLVEQVCRQEKQYSWLVMNARIAAKELAVSGVTYNVALREKRPLAFLLSTLVGNRKMVDELVQTCPDFVAADSIEALAGRMNALAENEDVDASVLRGEIERYDGQIARGKKLFNDDQLRRIAHLRRYRGDRLRTCKFQQIDDAPTYPLIAVRAFVISRKSLGGIQTDLSCHVLRPPDGGTQGYVEGLYAVGEAAGFGGGGIHGLRSLEGTFLGSCILTGRTAAHAIAGRQL